MRIAALPMAFSGFLLTLEYMQDDRDGLDKKTDGGRVQKILSSLVDYAKINSKFRAILEKHNLKVA